MIVDDTMNQGIYSGSLSHDRGDAEDFVRFFKEILFSILNVSLVFFRVGFCFFVRFLGLENWLRQFVSFPISLKTKLGNTVPFLCLVEDFLLYICCKSSFASYNKTDIAIYKIQIISGLFILYAVL